MPEPKVDREFSSDEVSKFTESDQSVKEHCKDMTQGEAVDMLIAIAKEITVRDMDSEGHVEASNMFLNIAKASKDHFEDDLCAWATGRCAYHLEMSKAVK